MLNITNASQAMAISTEPASAQLTKPQIAVGILNEIGLSLREHVTPGNKEGATAEAKKSAHAAYEMGNLHYLVATQLIGVAPHVAERNSSLFGAAIAFENKGGNCDHYAALTQFFTVALASKHLSIHGMELKNTYRCADTNAKHAFSAFDIADKQTGEVYTIVLDPWAPDAKEPHMTAHLAENYLFQAHKHVDNELQHYSFDQVKTPEDAVKELRAFGLHEEQALRTIVGQDYQVLLEHIKLTETSFSEYNNHAGFESLADKDSHHIDRELFQSLLKDEPGNKFIGEEAGLRTHNNHGQFGLLPPQPAVPFEGAMEL